MELTSLLVATDLSPRSIRVATFAGLLAQRLDIPATYVHVDELATVSIHDSAEAREYLDHIVSLREQGLRSLAEALSRALFHAQVACLSSNAPPWRIPQRCALAKPPESSTMQARPGGVSEASAAWV